VTFPLYKKEYKTWAKAPPFSSQGFCALDTGIVEKDSSFTIAGEDREGLVAERGLRNGDVLMKIDGTQVMPANLFSFFPGSRGNANAGSRSSAAGRRSIFSFRYFTGHQSRLLSCHPCPEAGGGPGLPD